MKKHVKLFEEVEYPGQVKRELSSREISIYDFNKLKKLGMNGNQKEGPHEVTCTVAAGEMNEIKDLLDHDEFEQVLDNLEYVEGLLKFLRKLASKSLDEKTQEEVDPEGLNELPDDRAGTP